MPMETYGVLLLLLVIGSVRWANHLRKTSKP